MISEESGETQKSNESTLIKPKAMAWRNNQWWKKRLLLSTLLALSLSTFFVLRATYWQAVRFTEQASSSESEIRVVFPAIPLLAVVTCWFGDLMIWILQTDSFERKNPTASVLSATLVRTMVILGALGFSSATKWPSHNLFGTYLMGCYFSFLALESWLAIRRSATRNYSPKPL